jgi:transglutaminase-like putative cysteine protease
MTAEALPARGVAVQIPRNSLALLMVAQAVVVVPYLFHLSPWIIAVGLFCGYWRTGVYGGRWDYPRRWVKAVLVLASVGGVALSGVAVFSLEAAASLLILAFALKLIEMKGRRDAYLVIFLAYFIIATQFLFDQSIAVAMYQVAALMVVTAAMVGLNQLATRVQPLESLRVAVLLVLQALPLTVVLFLLFPRIAPLWTVPMPSASKTGLSERMKPGDVTQLIRSDELAFRAVFDGPVPANRDLYWRGLTYSRFTEGTWSVVHNLLPEWQEGELPEAPGDRPGIAYEVLLEPTQSDWLYALEVPVARTPSLTLSRDSRLRAPDPVLSVFRYQITSYPTLGMDDQYPTRQALPDILLRRETWFPEDDNPRIQAFAAAEFARAPTAAGFVDAVLERIRRESFFYTLSPPALADRNSIDGFWFDTRRGFCTHYAGALVFMLRSVGVPARMVGGYQGGEVNPVTGHLMVRQYDAHAWAEYWSPGDGWTRVDPTAAVAPARIEQGLNAALSAEDRLSLSALTSARFDGLSMFRDLLYWADSLEHRWNLWVIGYDPNLQSNVLKELLGEITPARIGAALLVGGGLSLGTVALLLFWRRRVVARHPVERVFAAFCQRVAVTGWERAPAESPPAFIRRMAAEGAIREAQADPLVADLERLLYNPAAAWGGREVRRLRSQLRRLQFRLAFGSVR